MTSEQVRKRYEKRVDRGIARLNDYHGGSRWLNRINVKRLNILSPNNCPLGQLFDYYETGVREVFPEFASSDDNLKTSRWGFYPAFDENKDYRRYKKSGRLLTKIWKEKLRGM